MKSRKESEIPEQDDAASPNPEVLAVAQRRRFSAKFKNEVLEEFDRRKATGEEIGSYLRRKGLTTSHISNWRRARDKGSPGPTVPVPALDPTGDIIAFDLRDRLWWMHV